MPATVAVVTSENTVRVLRNLTTHMRKALVAHAAAGPSAPPARTTGQLWPRS